MLREGREFEDDLESVVLGIDQLGPEAVMNGDRMKQRNARQRMPVVAESEPVELSAAPPGAPSGVRPALALKKGGPVWSGGVRRVRLGVLASEERLRVDKADRVLEGVTRVEASFAPGPDLNAG